MTQRQFKGQLIITTPVQGTLQVSQQRQTNPHRHSSSQTMSELQQQSKHHMFSQPWQRKQHQFKHCLVINKAVTTSQWHSAPLSRGDQ